MIFKEEYRSPTKLPVTLLATLIVTAIESEEQTNSHRELQTAYVIGEVNALWWAFLCGSGAGTLYILQSTPLGERLVATS
jgi:hypothetical protein